MKASILFIVVWNLCSELVAVHVLQYEDGISGQIASPGYPGNYPNNVKYTWIIRTGSHSANVTFRIIEMSIQEWRPCNDYLEIIEIEPCCFRLFKRCGHLKNANISGRGKKIMISFISDKSMTEKGFHLTWRVTLPPTKALPTQKMLATTTKHKVRTTSKKMVVKTTALQLEITTPTPSQESVVNNSLQYEDGITGQITSPGYPRNYPNNVNYTWIIRTGSRYANVAFRIIEMNIKEWWYCDDYLEITEIEPCCFRLFKQCGQLKNYNLSGRGNKIRVSFISDERMTEKGFNLTWRVSLPQTKALPTQKMLATTTKYKVRTTSKNMDVKTTALQLETATPSPSQAHSTVQAKITSTPRTTESTTEDIISSTVQAMFSSALRTTESTTEDTTSSTLIPESPSTVKNTGRATSPPITSELLPSRSIQYSETKRTTLETRSRPLTLSSTTRSSSVELTTLVFNATTNKEDKNTFDKQTG